MRKQYDDFTQMKLKDMSKAMSEMTYQYINPDLNIPTVVPASHYESILNEIQEQYIGEITSKQILTVVFNQLKAIKQEDEKYFQQALLCLDLNIKPNDLKINEQIALNLTQEMLEKKKSIEKKDYHVIDQEIIDFFYETKNDPIVQANIIRYSNDNREVNSVRDYER